LPLRVCKKAGSASSGAWQRDIAQRVRITPAQLTHADVEHAGKHSEIGSNRASGSRPGSLVTVGAGEGAEKQVAVLRKDGRRHVARPHGAELFAPVPQRDRDRSAEFRRRLVD
jgi:hypothetical protein